MLTQNYAPDKLTIQQRLFEKIEEQKVDIIIARDDSDPFVRIALRSGMLLEKPVQTTNQDDENRIN